MTSEEIQAIFFLECEESLAAAEAGLAACRDGTQDDDTVNGVFRAVHSIKGGAGAFGFDALQAYTHCFETLLSDVREGKLEIGDALIELLLHALDTLSDHVSAVQEGGAGPDDAALIMAMTAAQADQGGVAESAAPAAVEAPVAEVVATDATEFGDDFDLNAMLDDITGDSTTPAPASAQWQAHVRPHAGAMRNGGEPILLLRELAALGGQCIACDTSHVPSLDGINPQQGYLGWTFAMPEGVTEDNVREVFDFVADDCGLAVGKESGMPSVRLEQIPAMASSASTPAPAQPATKQNAEPASSPTKVPPSAVDDAKAQAAPAPGQSIRIDLVKLDRLIDTVGELVIAQAMMGQHLASEGHAASEELVMLEGLTREIQESAMAIRAQPIGSVFSRVPRILRDLASSTGKQVKLELVGEATELDKTVIERLGEPLTHLIRNAVDHGIEDPQDRVAAGKSAEGTLRLSAEHRSGRILIRISDDGCGINRARVLAKAIDKGLVTPEASLTKEEIDHLIFAPGFSTAETVSSVSGRGVGMDVVRQNVKELGGRITIESDEGKGTCFTLTLPLTLAISDGMIVNVGDQTLVVPLAHVVESLRPRAGEVHGLGTTRQMLDVRGRFIPVLALHHLIGAGGTACAPTDGVLIVVDTESAGQAALLVDNICDQRQVVIKSLDTHYRSVEGVAGATILGDGQVALILDVDGLVASAINSSALKEAA